MAHQKQKYGDKIHAEYFYNSWRSHTELITYYLLLPKNPVSNFILGKREEVRSKK